MQKSILVSLTREQNNKEHVVGGRMLLPDAIYRNDFIFDALVSMLERSLNEMFTRYSLFYLKTHAQPENDTSLRASPEQRPKYILKKPRGCCKAHSLL